MAFQMSCWYHNRSGRAFTALSWPDTLLPRWAELLHRLGLRYPRWGQEDGGLQEDRSVWVEVGGWEMSIWTIRIRPRMTLSSSLYSSESQAGSSFGVDRDWDMFLCVCVSQGHHMRENMSPCGCWRVWRGWRQNFLHVLISWRKVLHNLSPTIWCHFQVRVHVQRLLLVVLLICKSIWMKASAEWTKQFKQFNCTAQEKDIVHLTHTELLWQHAPIVHHVNTL